MPYINLSHVDIAEIIAKHYGVVADRVQVIGNGASAKVLIPLEGFQKVETPVPPKPEQSYAEFMGH